MSKFEAACIFLGLGNVGLTELFKIQDGLFRAKIPNDQKRLALLSKARDLKNSEFSSCYIQRDLTYRQRQDLIAKRRARSLDSSSNTNGFVGAESRVPARGSHSGNGRVFTRGRGGTSAVASYAQSVNGGTRRAAFGASHVRRNGNLN